MVDKLGLYTHFVDEVLAQVGDIMFVVSDVPDVKYLVTLMEEQPTLRYLFHMGRVVPIFGEGS